MTDEYTLELTRRLAQAMRRHRLRLVTAESCTGGAIACACTELAGSSAWFERGFVTYSNESKQEALQVQAATPIRAMKLYDALGRLVKTVETSPAQVLRFSVADLPVGMYFLRGQTVDGQGLHARLRVE